MAEKGKIKGKIFVIGLSVLILAGFLMFATYYISDKNQFLEVKDAADDPGKYENSEIRIIGKVGEIYYDNDNPNEPMFELHDLKDNNIKIIVNATHPVPYLFNQSETVKVIGIMESENGTHMVRAVYVLMESRSTGLDSLFTAYSIVWMGWFIYLVYVHQKQGRLEADIKNLQEMVSFSERRK